MSWEGSGAPVFVVDGSAHLFPRPVLGGRVETWPKEVDETRKTILGEVVRGRKLYRFKAEYTWTSLTDEQVAQLIGWDNEDRDVLVKPYSDTGTLHILCRIAEVLTPQGAVVTAQSKVTVKFEALALVDSRPIPDRRVVGGGIHPKHGVVS